MPNPIQQKNHPLQGVFDALEQIGTHLVTKGQEENKRMVAIQNDPVQAAKLATVIRQATAQGRSNEEVAAGLGFTGDNAVPFIKTIAGTYPQQFDERVAEVQKTMDLAGLTGKQALLSTGMDIRKLQTESDLGVPEQQGKVTAGELGVNAIEFEQRDKMLTRWGELGGPQAQAMAEYQVLKSQGRAAEEAVQAWNSHDELIESWKTSDNPLLRDIAGKAGMSITEQGLLTRLAHLEGLDWQTRMSANAGAAGADIFKLVDMQDTMQDRQDELAEEWQAILEIKDSKAKKAALAAWELKGRSYMTTIQILKRANPFFDAVFAGAQTTRDGQGAVVPFGGIGMNAYNLLTNGETTPEEIMKEIESMRQEGFNENDIASLEVWLQIYEDETATILPDWLSEWLKAREASYYAKVRAQSGAPGGRGVGGGGGGAGGAELAPGTSAALDWAINVGTTPVAAAEVASSGSPDTVSTQPTPVRGPTPTPVETARTKAGLDKSKGSQAPKLQTIPAGSGGPPPIRIHPDPPTLNSVPGGLDPVETLKNDELDFLYEEGKVSTADYVKEIARRGR